MISPVLLNPDLLHSLLGADGLDDFVQTLPLIL